MMNFSDDNVMLLILCHKEFSLEYGITHLIMYQLQVAMPMIWLLCISLNLRMIEGISGQERLIIIHLIQS